MGWGIFCWITCVIASLVLNSQSDHYSTIDLAAEDEVINSQPQKRQVSIREAAIAFREMLQDIEGIEGILGEQSTDGPSLSVIVNKASREHRRAIYDREMQLVQRLDTGFDFRLIDRRDQPLYQIASVELYDIYLRA